MQGIRNRFCGNYVGVLTDIIMIGEHMAVFDSV